MKPAGVQHVAICVADAQKGLVILHDPFGNLLELNQPE